MLNKKILLVVSVDFLSVKIQSMKKKEIPMSLIINEEAVEHVKKLIEEGKIDMGSHWNKSHQPSAEVEDQFAVQHGWKEYGKWFLAVDPDIKEYEKQHYEFPYGDFKKAYREGLVAVKRRAAQYKHSEVENVADELLQLIEKKEGLKLR